MKMMSETTNSTVVWAIYHSF